MFHFNIQYVAGGLSGFGQATLRAPGPIPDFELTEQEVEDRIITESFEPLLGILERNPDLALTFEMQGLMVDVMRARHPDVLGRLRVLARRGQAELASIHWSDQFFLAFGPQDMDVSWRLTQESFAAADLPLSPVVFTQEGQFGEGFAAWLKRVRPDAVMIMPRNLFNFYQDGVAEAALWDEEGLPVVLPKGYADGTVERQWSFFDDGELLATADLNPYLGKQFREDAASVRAYERRLRCLADAGVRVGKVGDYVEAVREAGYEAPPLPPFLDGTWQPNSTRGPLRWMGGAGQTWPRHEEDRSVLVTCLAARQQVLGLDALIAWDEAQAGPDDLAELELAWRDLLLGEVSDARGVNPWYGEIQYGLRHCEAARQRAQARLDALARGYVERNPEALGLRVDTQARTVAPLFGIPEPEPRVEVDAPVELRVVADRGAPPLVTWTLREGAPAGPDNPYRVEVEWPAVPGAREDFDACAARYDSADEVAWRCAQDQSPLVIEVARTPGWIEYRPALGDAWARYTEADFRLQALASSDAAWTTAADGAVGLGQGRYWVKDIGWAPLAVGFPAGEGRNGVVQVRDETLPPKEGATWAFWYVESEEGASRLARRNLWPLVDVYVAP
jgi:hypothetical protein